jgi:hypothetical protein
MILTVWLPMLCIVELSGPSGNPLQSGELKWTM